MAIAVGQDVSDCRPPRTSPLLTLSTQQPTTIVYSQPFTATVYLNRPLRLRCTSLQCNCLLQLFTPHSTVYRCRPPQLHYTTLHYNCSATLQLICYILNRPPQLFSLSLSLYDRLLLSAYVFCSRGRVAHDVCLSGMFRQSADPAMAM
jgi:hypothetical protein